MKRGIFQLALLDRLTFIFFLFLHYPVDIHTFFAYINNAKSQVLRKPPMEECLKTPLLPMEL